VIVNNAGYADLTAVEDMTIDAFRAQIDTNLLGVVKVTKAALPVMRKQHAGLIVQISSVGGRIANPDAQWRELSISTDHDHITPAALDPLGYQN
jgi:NAD(P)-dependent dehydrogenase (short-subunit alcohol dehydrogenase family)